ncbi:MAG: 50S ribosome-binding GTPase [Ignavibacteria bacterium]|nr:50S ribosome-binding GTPase [Ignavibacteria bacterium]MBT8391597.1 50S ribosome-binding GTPase [Ignavibacteria bacterium]NNJ53730.1 TGS domain-containing protein [Ignavibacteriaceae bacterium]NNL21537.1 TGS domain-containing protein [Ignavibacteriaceae bacterium]
MPTNLPPEYFAADKKFREAESASAKISALEEMMSTIPKHKGTDKLRADLRRKISKLKSVKQKKKGGVKHESEYHIEKEGAGRVVIIGLPNVGKSSLVAQLTHAEPKISESPFTTWQPMPGMMPIDDIQIQLVDTPPLNKVHIEPELFDLLRTSDLILILVDLQATPFQQLEDSLDMLREHKIYPKQKKGNSENEQKINSIPFLVVVNKDDDDKCDEDFKVFTELLETDLPLIPISIEKERKIEKLKSKIFEVLEIMRIYSKPPGKEADLTKPFVVKIGSNVEEFASKVHHDFYQKLKTARVWGSSVFDGQLVGRDHILHDKDVVELHL